VTRRFAILFIVAAFLGLAATPVSAGEPEGEIALGNPKAPITIVEYFSMTCSHCANFDIETLPELKKQWIDTGKARFVFKDFPLDSLALRGAMLTRCVAAERGPEAYARLIEMLMKTQDNWMGSKNMAQNAQALDASVMLAGGQSKQKIETCLANKKLEEAILNGQLEAQKTYKIKSTPSFVIGGKMYAGAMSIEQLNDVLKGQ
jgi:protein-disulfide isomerase